MQTSCSRLFHYEFDDSNEQSESYHHKTPRDYNRGIYYEVLNTLIDSIKERFDQPCFEAYENLESLLLKPLKLMNKT